MGIDLYEGFATARSMFDEAERISGYSLGRLCFEGPAEELNRDLPAQLAVYTVSCILTELLRKEGAVPDAVSGYSSGFYAAAYAARCFDFSTGVRLVLKAGRILLEEGRRSPGGMALIFGLKADRVEQICEQIGGVQVAIRNTHTQIIISGLWSSLEVAMDQCRRAGALDAYVLPVGAAYHSRFMKNAESRLVDVTTRMPLRSPSIPLISYLTLSPVPEDKGLRRVIAAQVSGPVKWVELITSLSKIGTERIIEVGPGAIISRAVRWIDRSMEAVQAGDYSGVLKVATSLNTARIQGIK